MLLISMLSSFRCIDPVTALDSTGYLILISFTLLKFIHITSLTFVDHDLQNAPSEASLSYFQSVFLFAL